MAEAGGAERGSGDPRDAMERIAAALERLSPCPSRAPDFGAAEAYVWRTDPDRFEPVYEVNRIDLRLLKGIDRVRDAFLANLRQFAGGHAANNVLLWGARGMGKSSLVKAAHKRVRDTVSDCLLLVEIDRTDIGALHRLLADLEACPERRFLLFCDDLSFESPDSAYKSLKAVLDGGVRGRPPNVLFAATSNRRHLMPRDMIENERQTAIAPSEATEEKVSLSDRFGLWLGFHSCTQDSYLEMVRGYADEFGIGIGDEDLNRRAIAWRQARGAVSGRVAWQFALDLAGSAHDGGGSV